MTHRELTAWRRGVISGQRQAGVTLSRAHRALARVRGFRGVPYSTFARWFHAAERPYPPLPPPTGAAAQDTMLCELVMASLYTGHTSCRAIAADLDISRTTAWRCLVASGAQYRHARWIPHALTAAQMAERVELAAALREVVADPILWDLIITVDESWVYFETFSEGAWCVGDQRPPPRWNQGQGQGGRKLGVVVFWSTLGFHLVHFFGGEERIDAATFCTWIRELRQGMLDDPWFDPHLRVYIHMDNAPAHRARQTVRCLAECGFEALPHPPYSPDLAPSDFYLFGRVKSRLRGRHFESAGALRHAFLAELRSIDRNELERVYSEWARRLARCVEIGGEYV